MFWHPIILTQHMSPVGWLNYKSSLTGGRDALPQRILARKVATFKWRGVGGRTVAKTLQYDLPVVASSTPDIVILQLGTNDLSRLDPLVVASSIEELVTILHDTYNVELICVCHPMLCSTRVFARLTNTLKCSSKPSLMSFWGT